MGDEGAGEKGREAIQTDHQENIDDERDSERRKKRKTERQEHCDDAIYRTIKGVPRRPKMQRKITHEP